MCSMVFLLCHDVKGILVLRMRKEGASEASSLLELHVYIHNHEIVFTNVQLWHVKLCRLEDIA